MELLDKNSSSEKEEFESFASCHKNGVFMQSLQWASVKENWDWDAIISKDEHGEIKGTCLVLIKKIPLLGCSFLYAPHGPVCDYNDKETLADLLDGAKALAKKYNAYEFMWDPCFEEKDTEATELMRSLGFIHIDNAPELSTIQARNNYMLRDIQGKSEDEIMQSFKSDWRNRIRKASRKGVVCRVCGKEALADFYPMMIETGKRDGFSIRSKEYFAKMLDGLGKDHCRLFMCYYEESGQPHVPVSGAIVTQYAGKTCYVYGASANHHRNTYPNYLMQWNMIKWAMSNNSFIYDFQGIPFYNDESHPNYGVYKFKKGFNGDIVTYAGEFFYTFSPIKKKLVSVMEKAYRKLHRLNTLRLLNNRCNKYDGDLKKKG